MDSVSLTADERAALEGLAAELRRVFDTRLHSVAGYGLEAQAASPRLLHTLALVERLSFADLAACMPLAAGWRRRSLAVPLILEREEFLRTLDVFPLEYGDIIANHVLVAGANPFTATRIAPADVRRACELSAKSHLIHLREAFMETGGDTQAIGRLDSDPDIAGTAERQIGIPAPVVREVLSAGSGTQSTIAEPTALLARYIAAAERVWEYVDTWRARA